MGGLGSGNCGNWSRWGPTRTPADTCHTLDINYLHKKGVLRPEAHATVSWTYTTRRHFGDKEPRTASIGVDGRVDGVQLRYTTTDPTDDDRKEEHQYVVPVVRVPCNYGGTRPYFICPGYNTRTMRACNRRVAKLYKPPHRSVFLCRHCYNLTYHSCNESGDLHWTMRRRTMRVARKLGITGNHDNVYNIRRPNGMHDTTFRRLKREFYERRENEHHAFMVAMMRIENHVYKDRELASKVQDWERGLNQMDKLLRRHYHH